MLGGGGYRGIKGAQRCGRAGMRKSVDTAYS